MLFETNLDISTFVVFHHEIKKLLKISVGIIKTAKQI
jgi:hypothetical protein